MSAREILARIERERAEQLAFRGFQRKDPTREALAQWEAEQKAKRGAAPLPSGGLWDETSQRQQELFG